MDDDTRIEQYIMKKMNREERDSFESDLVNDKVLAEKLRSYQMAKNISENLPYLEAEEILDTFERQLKRKRRLWTYLPAAVIVTLILFFVGLNGFGKNKSEQTLIAEFMITQNLETQRSISDTNDPYLKAEYLFSLNRFEESIAQLDSVELNNPKSRKLMIRNYLGMNLYAEANKISKELDRLDPEVQYLDALTNIGLKQNDIAIKILEGLLTSENEEISKLSKALLEKISTL